MLLELVVKNLGVVSELNLLIDDGMTAVTGETGAGKTMIVGALGLLSGSRAEPSMVRDGATEATVEGRFVHDDEEFVVRRIVPANGRSRAYIDGAMVSRAELTERMSCVVDLYAQHAHQSLLSGVGQRQALDRYGKVDLSELHVARRHVRALEAEREALGGDLATRAREVELLRYQLDELAQARIVDPNEDDALGRELTLLGNVVARRERAQRSLALLNADQGIVDLLAASVAELEDDGQFGEVHSRLSSLHAELVDATAELRQLTDEIVENPQRLEDVAERRKVLADFRRRYGSGTLSGVIEAHGAIRERFDALVNADERVLELTDEIDRAREVLARVSAHVGTLRRSAAGSFSEAVALELKKLAMPNAQFQVVVGDEDPGDDVEMLFGANAGLALGPIARIASGGELARTMLALRLVAVAEQETLVFDEVDAGIGGTAATAVGHALASLAQKRQVLVVTHLAQVAAAADTQVGVIKTTQRGETKMSAKVLDGESRVVELSRMMSGQPTSDVAHAHAHELLAHAKKSRRNA